MKVYTLASALLLLTTACGRSSSSAQPQSQNGAASNVQAGAPKKSTATGKVDIPGEWNSGKVKAIVMKKLGPVPPPDEVCDACPLPYHEVLGEYKFPYRNQEIMIVAAASGTYNDCLTCEADVSLFKFERRENGWAFIGSEMDVIKMGIHGGVTPESIQLFALGNDTYGLTFDCYWQQEGYMGATTVIMARLGNRFRQVLRLETREDNSGAEDPASIDWDSKIQSVPGKDGFYDLAITRTGTRKGESLRFTFNGRKYARARKTR